MPPVQKLFAVIAWGGMAFFPLWDCARAAFAGNFVFQGDSITQGVGASATTDFTADVAANSITGLGTVYSCGVGGATAYNTNYFPSGVTPNVTPTSTTTGSASSAAGLSGTMCVGGIGIPSGTTATFSGTSVTFSQAITAPVGASETMYFCIEEPDYYSYPQGNATYINTAPRLLSPLVSGTPGYYFIAYGTNDASGPFGTATFTSGSNIATGYTGTSSVTVGNYIFSPGVAVGATISAVSGNSGNYSVTFSGAPSTVSGSQNVGVMVPTQFTTYYQSYMQAMVNQAFADNYSQVFVLTTPPTYNTSGVPFNNAKILFNNWIKSTYGNGATPHVTVIDVASAPEFQTANRNYQNYYSTDLIHPSILGHQIWAQYIIASIGAVSGGDSSDSPTMPVWGWFLLLFGLGLAGCRADVKGASLLRWLSIFSIRRQIS